MIYEQATGILKSAEGLFIQQGYSGNGIYKNNPKYENLPNHGPIPIGIYKIGEAYNSPLTGPLTLPLTPYPNNEMFGRFGFKIHGDNVSDPGNGSDGCIVMPRIIRETINLGNDKTLIVV
jgi:hypothetical protein